MTTVLLFGFPGRARLQGREGRQTHRCEALREALAPVPLTGPRAAPSVRKGCQEVGSGSPVQPFYCRVHLPGVRGRHKDILKHPPERPLVVWCSTMNLCSKARHKHVKSTAQARHHHLPRGVYRYVPTVK